MLVLSKMVQQAPELLASLEFSHDYTIIQRHFPITVYHLANTRWEGERFEVSVAALLC